MQGAWKLAITGSKEKITELHEKAQGNDTILE